MELTRRPTIEEERLLELLVKRSSVAIPENWKTGLLVCPADDGEMGGLLLIPLGKMATGRNFGEQVSDYQYKDLDGIEVVASLSVDEDGDLFELDMWKTNFGKLLKYPEL